VDDQDIDLDSLLPLGESCAIIITSRNRSLGQLCPDAHLELDTMSMDEAVDLLLHRSGSSTAITEQMRKEACAIARALGCLPIALIHARNYMFQTLCSGEEYLKRLLDNQDKLLAQPVKHHRDMRYVSTHAAFEASFVLLTLRCQKLLRLLSYFHWRDFPLDLVITAAKHNFSDYEHVYVEHGDGYYAGRAVLRSIFLREDKWDITDLDEMMIMLQNHSLLTLLPGAGTQRVQMHPVAHSWVKSRISEQDSETYESAAILLLALSSRWEYTPAVQYLVSHITSMSSVWDELDINNAQAFGLILDHGGLYEDALRLRERVVKEVRGRGGQDIDVNGTSLWYLALTYRKLGRLKEAAVLKEEVLKLRKARQGETHPDTIMASNTLALTYRDLDRLKEAEVLQEQALKLSREVLGEMSPDTIKAANNLAFIYRDLGRLKEALVLQEEALKWGEEALGKMHPLTVGALNNLALAYRDLGLLEKAEEIQLNVVELSNKSVGPRHPQALWSSANLAGIHYSLGRLSEAHLRQEEVLRLRKEIIGEYHPNTINAAKNLAKTYCSMGRLNEAQELHEEVLRWREETLGNRHLATISARAYLAVTLFNSGKLSEAEALQAGVLATRTEILGERHYKSAGAMLDLAETCHALGRKDEAIQLVTRATTIISDTLGDSHPMYRRCQHITSHIQSEDDPPAYVSPASIVPSSSVMTVASSSDPEASSDHRHKRRRLLS
jgi:tetratricopeptide (TPR) repeat protein